TLRLLFTRPGQLTAEMLAGRRARYIPPVRLYLVASVVFFLALGSLWRMDKVRVTATGADTAAASHRAGEAFRARVASGMKRAAGDRKAFAAAVLSRAPKAAILMVPVFALL